ncbi:hypothetical protein [Streptomyces sp. NPDC048002]|uniref:hypothetical protein n=1 Tax=Streptomyces sp. NPDC048002 TaxID=3154344 RepID=UPI0034009CC3
MTRNDKHRVLSDRLGIPVEAGEWSWIDKIPEPPADVLQAAGNPPLRPARLGPLALIGTALGKVLWVVFLPVILILIPLSKAEEAIKRALDSKEEKESRRAKKDAEKRRDAMIAEQGLDKVFDGDWNGGAGQFLLRWYTHSTHPQRLLLATPDGIALAAPPQRVSTGREKHMQIVARIPAAEASLVDPFSGEFETRILLIRFRDGSWLRVDTEELRSELHMHVLRNSRTTG